MRQNKKEDRSYLMGVALVILGGIFLLGNFGLIPEEIHNLAFNWKGIIFVIGILSISTKSNKYPGAIMICLALYFIFGEYLWQEFRINIGLSQILWPGILIGTGIILLNKRKIEFKRQSSGHSFDYLNDANILGGGEVKVRSDQFKGGQVTAIFGGSSYDLSGSRLANGQHTLEVFALFGGFTFVLPTDWEIHLETTAIFGGVTDKRKFTKRTESGTGNTLHIKGFVLFGGGEIKNY
ncbi:cell wall-active antibiotics response protein [Reichenbachiella carrageenanivorans]|uniref:Cell wall-active antibiotics response protein n=1 Tax=Reichenbachiella carrageenanivorans TaxID=2979869 RepID=A0ABY6CZN0_9BACT|nr:cell wall-active antibiotics response protein [Reichenbachiella carrageenanivorans]UXX78283.1 cell wall-active antibiotics response protein [Reichenbachiella carrageenanivorans]